MKPEDLPEIIEIGNSPKSSFWRAIFKPRVISKEEFLKNYETTNWYNRNIHCDPEIQLEDYYEQITGRKP